MVTMSAAERAGLIKLGDLAMNRSKRDSATFVMPKTRAFTDDDAFVIASTFGSTAQKLLIVGGLLGEHGKRFAEEGERILRQNLYFMPSSHAGMREIAEGMPKVYGQRRRLNAAHMAAGMGAALALPGHDDGTEASVRELSTWYREELFEILLSAEEKRTKQNCTFCGARSGQDRKLLVCGRCKSALYCDKV